LYEGFLEGEADDESIVPPGAYPTRQAGTQPVGAAANAPDEGAGSNNWVIAGSRTVTGKPIVASDPHIAFAAVSCWYEAHLCGGSFNAAGMAYAGMPAIMFGRNSRVAWGITNNICSQRDLYQERTSPDHPGCFLFDGQWEPARELTEEIRVRGGDTVRKTVRFSRNGPIVDDILPPVARGTGPVSLRWLGATNCRWLTSLLAMDRAGSADAFREALRGWRVPTWNLVFADADGHTGYQAAGDVPIRGIPERGYRPGWEPAHQWRGVVPWEGMPRLADPARGWIATANNRPAPDDFPYPLSGTWASGHRARRIRQMIEERGELSKEAVAEMQMDVLSLRAAEGVPRLLRTLAGSSNARLRRAAGALREWDCRMETDRVGAAVFEVFFTHWCRTVSSARFQGETADALSPALAGLALRLLDADPAGWFPAGRRETAAAEALNAALDELASRLGPDMASWEWGRLHTIRLRHVLSGRGELADLLDRGGLPVRGNGVTVCNTGFDPNWGAPMGANYRLIADMSTSPPALWAQESQGQSGHPGSKHYCDQLPEWLAGRHHPLPLDRTEASKATEVTLRLEPEARTPGL
ncbi:MAG: penicillin acylase family protein, partial [Gemmatimonadetes bacterium]|nr:penicillin acylase family protein [Gemmatimonadota bacterium]